jgi:hypothetical protein
MTLAQCRFQPLPTAILAGVATLHSRQTCSPEAAAPHHVPAHGVPRDAAQPVRVALQHPQLLPRHAEERRGAVGAACQQVGGLLRLGDRRRAGSRHGIQLTRLDEREGAGACDGTATHASATQKSVLREPSNQGLAPPSPAATSQAPLRPRAFTRGDSPQTRPTCPSVACGCHAMPVARSGCALKPRRRATFELSVARHRLTAPPQPQAASTAPSGLNAQPPTGRSSPISELCCASFFAAASDASRDALAAWAHVQRDR